MVLWGFQGGSRAVVDGAARLCATGPPSTSTSTPLGGHALCLTTFRLGELRRYDDEAQVEHEERTNLNPTTAHVPPMITTAVAAALDRK